MRAGENARHTLREGLKAELGVTKREGVDQAFRIVFAQACCRTPHVPLALNPFSRKSMWQPASGKIVGATIIKSSSNSAIDEAALQTIRKSTYSPALENCKPATAPYLFRPHFQPGP